MFFYFKKNLSGYFSEYLLHNTFLCKIKHLPLCFESVIIFKTRYLHTTEWKMEDNLRKIFHMRLFVTTLIWFSCNQKHSCNKPACPCSLPDCNSSCSRLFCNHSSCIPDFCSSCNPSCSLPFGSIQPLLRW